MEGKKEEKVARINSKYHYKKNPDFSGMDVLRKDRERWRRMSCCGEEQLGKAKRGRLQRTS